ncbi:hypothetical protein J2Z37_001867 [Ammoniphilus resinae]|uniref:Uncharacterized protein n=1 Tax=Ammoniphilus resinae TaxID=861532 RepID=A0ABS4GNP8_9BACL|nr:hypothetical protein [Ammoniphilus resinae]
MPYGIIRGALFFARLLNYQLLNYQIVGRVNHEFGKKVGKDVSKGPSGR